MERKTQKRNCNNNRWFKQKVSIKKAFVIWLGHTIIYIFAAMIKSITAFITFPAVFCCWYNSFVAKFAEMWLIIRNNWSKWILRECCNKKSKTPTIKQNEKMQLQKIASKLKSKKKHNISMQSKSKQKPEAGAKVMKDHSFYGNQGEESFSLLLKSDNLDSSFCSWTSWLKLIGQCFT